MNLNRRAILVGGGLAMTAPRIALADDSDGASLALRSWYRLVLELIRHTATFSPPVASRALGYLGVIAWEALAEDSPGARSMAGQLNGLPALPAATTATMPALRLHAALSAATQSLFSNTGPSGLRALRAMDARLGERLGADREDAQVRGRAIAAHVLDWAATDGGQTIENMGFPTSWQTGSAPESWVPTSLIRQQQAPLLPGWGSNRPLAMPDAAACPLPPPPPYSEEPGSAFHAEALEVYDTARLLTDEQKQIARFWSDDPMLSPTPPGHWMAIVLQIAERDDLPAIRLAEVLARCGIAVADAFIACWASKYDFDLLRPVTYIRRVIDPDWQPLLITPPFPEYPSGHSTMSGAAATVLTTLFGPGFGFDDATHVDDGMPLRRFADFNEAAREAALSRLYGGIHFRSAIDRGLEQGACVAAHATALRMTT